MRLPVSRFLAIAAAMAFAAVPLHAEAQSFERVATGITDTLQTAIDFLPEDVTNIRLGIGPSLSPQYEGSKHYNINAVPVISLRWKNMIEVDNNEVKLTAFRRLTQSTDTGGGGNLRIGPLVSINFGRGEDAPELKGMGEVGTSLELGGFVSYSWNNNTRVRLRIRQDVISGHKGATASVDVTQAFIRTNKFALGGVVSTTFASAAYMKSFFGVTGTQSAATGYSVYRPGSSFKDVTFGLNGNYVLFNQWSLVANAGYERLIARAADSPLVSKVGSPNQLSASAFIVYSF